MDTFWNLIDEILDATLFVLICMEALLVVFTRHELATVCLAVAVTLLSRLLTVGLPPGRCCRAFSICRGDPRRY